MNACPDMVRCPLLQDFLSYAPEQGKETQRRYCERRYSSCARYMVLRELGPVHTPPDILPDDTARAKQILARLLEPPAPQVRV